MIGDRWGVTDDEVARAYPCDELAARPELRAWRGVTIEAPVADVWPWIFQIRLAPYSYDWIDNLGRRSPRRPVRLPDPRPGDHFTTAFGCAHGRVLSVDAGRQLTATIMGGYMSFVLVPAGDGTTRLLLKVIMQTAPWKATLLSVSDLIMARRQLLNLKELAEHHPRPDPASGTPASLR
jgi:hypothetical protein